MELNKQFEEYKKNNCKNCMLECPGIRKTLNGVDCHEKKFKNKS